MEILGQKISAGKFDFFYRSAGTGSETLVLLHGIPTNSYLWIHVIPQLAQKYRVIAPDMIGYGGSDRSTHEDLTLPMQAQHIVSLLDTLGLQKVHIIGHDLGGGVAQILAVHYPERVSSFMVIDGVAFSNWPLREVVALRFPTAPAFEPSIYFIERMLREGLFHQNLLTPEVLLAFITPFNHPGGAIELQEASLALEHIQTENLVPQLKQLQIPAAFLYGQYDRFLPPYWGQRLQEAVPGSTFKVLPECGHFSMIDNPLLVSEEILKHLSTRT
ncbi:alpha/beta hydrolase [Mesobacillus foraminis]|uniref:alpha/beta fold hydrolase n=1 Tax=Mesobacillus foraminis TaxID=279826 RepID=UPI001BE6F285|nr:alpha/beta hydrolase [Mesobacillus foraminis]MBT2759170.1 alpha/beta hydrolase [Mesobacillus foraminis]